ncbi:LPXTG cell wall anchor domain-containing protein [Streptococcus didelphis]|uniref:LPXTG cell wall anchor domain-containing protein n=1 Tax=Streptococcus didelphis TaxID=102886 RepID=A0ABY9LHX5_9STRE|nr:LPXTG cell wall anchor domain-containing protein [Streptococcus didelphis]WMB28428.1 LPXTG cell wall anchor domain-containing protein [Streptococcus didelphis]
MLEFSAYAYSGQSGSPVILKETNELVGVLAHKPRPDHNEIGTLGVRMMTQYYNWIQSFIDKEEAHTPLNPTDNRDSVEKGKTDEQADGLSNASQGLGKNVEGLAYKETSALKAANFLSEDKNETSQLPSTGEKGSVWQAAIGLFVMVASFGFLKKKVSEK